MYGSAKTYAITVTLAHILWAAILGLRSIDKLLISCEITHGRKRGNTQYLSALLSVKPQSRQPGCRAPQWRLGGMCRDEVCSGMALPTGTRLWPTGGVRLTRDTPLCSRIHRFASVGPNCAEAQSPCISDGLREDLPKRWLSDTVARSVLAGRLLWSSPYYLSCHAYRPRAEGMCRRATPGMPWPGPGPGFESIRRALTMGASSRWARRRRCTTCSAVRPSHRSRGPHTEPNWSESCAT